MDYKRTLNLPETSFPMKARLVEREPALLERWRRMGAYERLRERRRGSDTYILHDGPPYSNGHIHLGHALNKVAKDLIVRSRTMMGFDAPYLPGWDNHGMPIEMNILREMKKERRDVDPMTLRARCREYAGKYVDIQREEFVRLGIWGEWKTPYLTMDRRYEASVLRTFGEMIEQGFIYRGKRPIHWCPTCETALAESEIEYREKESVSITLRFPLRSDPAGVFPTDHDGFVLVWTTTPWTIPANLAVVVHPEIDYVVVTAGKDAWLLAGRLAPVIMESLGVESWEVARRVKGDELTGLVFSHPLIDRESPLFMADHVNLEEGTGVVHTAPGHGMEDFLVGQRKGLEILCPVDERGVFTAEALKYEGQPVDAANGAIVEDLEAAGTLLHRETIRHQYPHCWRCKQPLIYRATTQWFFSIDHKGLRERAIEAIEAVDWLPPTSRNRILGMMKNRPDWCLSRQREWGVGVPILTCTTCGRPLMERAVVDRVADRVGREGSDCWFTLDEKAFLPEGMTCPGCGGNAFRKETDILDVWFESGSSHIAVLEANAHLRSPADIVLEGSDQHRGWFNTSLIVGLAARGRAPYRRVLTNGWTLDARGKAMHKLEGNVVSPLDIIETLGADVLRLWVASNDLKSDIRISEDTLDQVSETYRRIRNTARFLLGNLARFDPARDRVLAGDLLEVDAYALHLVERFKRKVISAYGDMEFHVAYHTINTFCTAISAWYLDGLKDRLYTYAPRSPGRRSAQTVLHEFIHVLVRIIAPILPFTAEEVWDHIGGGEGDSIHFQLFPPARDDLLRPDLAGRWDRLLHLRGEVQKGLELARTNGVIGSSQEASVALLPEGEEWRGLLRSSREALPAFFIVSEVRVESAGDGREWLEPADLPVKVSVRRADGAKCVRCWNYTTDVGNSPEHPALCLRCVTMLRERKDGI